MELVNAFLSSLARSILLAVIPVISASISALLITKVRALTEGLKREMGNYGWVLEEFATIAVRAAEQANIAGLIKDKKQYAVEILDKSLKDHGFNVNLDVISAAIEAAVLQEFNRDK